MIQIKDLSDKGRRFVRSVSAVLLAFLLLIMLVGCVEGIYKPYVMDPQEDLSAPGQSETITDDKIMEPDAADPTETADTAADPPPEQQTTAQTTVQTTAATSAQTGDTGTTASSQAETLPTEPPSETSANITEPSEAPVQEIDEDGFYYSKDDVALYIHTYGHLPSNYITKKEANELGWKGGSLEKYKKGYAIGGDRFGNREGLLPKQKGRVYTECDIDTNGKKSRGAKRIIFSNDGLIFYTDDHYESFTQLYP